MGVFPRRNFTTTIKMFTPLADHLSKKLGRKVQLVVGQDFDNFWQDVSNERYDIVHYNQYHYLKSHKENGYRVIAKNEEFGSSMIVASIVVRKDSNIKSLKQLKGKKIMFGGNRQAMVSYIMATYILRQAGLKSGHYWENFAINPPNACLTTFFRQSDASGIGEVVLRLPIITKRIAVSEIKPIAKSRPIHHLPWAVKKSMKKEDRQKITWILTRLHRSEEGKAILKKAGLTAIRPATDRNYKPLRSIIYTVTGERL
jgi:phosphonate transport system substrate-binding protein